MKIIYNGYMGREITPLPECDSEVQDAVKEAVMLVEGKHGFRTHFEIWRNCELIITIGHNMETTSIDALPILSHRHNWANRDRTKAILI